MSEVSSDAVFSTSADTIAANLEQLTALERQLGEDRSKLMRRQRRTCSAVSLNSADIEQQHTLEMEVNELRRRRDTALDGNHQTERQLSGVLEQVERLQYHLDTPEGTPLPPRSARDARRTPAERIEIGMRAVSASMRAGPAGAALRPVSTSAGRPSSAGSAINLATTSGGALADLERQRKEDFDISATELRLYNAQHRRDSYEHMAARLRREKQDFDPRFAVKRAELQRHKKRAAQLRIDAGKAVQAHTNAEMVKRSTERKIALRQRHEKALLAEQQATLLSTQQSVLHFEVSRMSRSQSAIRFDERGGANAASEIVAWSDPALGTDFGGDHLSGEETVGHGLSGSASGCDAGSITAFLSGSSLLASRAAPLGCQANERS